MHHDVAAQFDWKTAQKEQHESDEHDEAEVDAPIESEDIAEPLGGLRHCRSDVRQEGENRDHRSKCARAIHNPAPKAIKTLILVQNQLIQLEHYQDIKNSEQWLSSYIHVCI